MIVEYDDAFRFLKDRPVDFIFKSSNKGFEAVAHVRRDNMDYILALCEGNECQGGDKGRKPGGGRVQLFEKRKKHWSHSRTIALPDTLPFVDYSGMSIDDGCVAIVSQVNSMLWVGRFDEAGWTWHDAGRLYAFPRSDDGAIRYGNIEGVAWITRTRVVTVSDRARRSISPRASPIKINQSIFLTFPNSMAGTRRIAAETQCAMEPIREEPGGPGTAELHVCGASWSRCTRWPPS